MKNVFACMLFIIISFLNGSFAIAQAKKLTAAFYFSHGIVADSKGNAFITGKNDKIIKINAAGKAELFAGGGNNFDDALGSKTRFAYTEGIAIDAADNLYVADGSRIRKISPDASVITIAGNLSAGINDGSRQTAGFLHTGSIAVDNAGNIYVTDYAPPKDWRPGQIANTGRYVIRKISADGMVTTLQNETGNKLILQYPKGLACDNEGNLYICASVTHCIKVISPSGAISTLAGQCDKTLFRSIYKEGPVATAILTDPEGIAIAKNGDVYIADARLHRIIKIANKKVSTVSGSGKMDFVGNPAGLAEPGYVDGKASVARFNAPNSIAFDRNGNLFIVDAGSSVNSYIRKLSTDGIVTTFCKHEWNPKTSQYEEVE